MQEKESPLGKAEIETLLRKTRRIDPPAGVDAGRDALPHKKDDSGALGKQEIEALLKNTANRPGLPPGDVEFILNEAQAVSRSRVRGTSSGGTSADALAAFDPGTAAKPAASAAVFRLEELTAVGQSPERVSLESLKDVELDLRIELGRTHMHLDEVLQLRSGSVVALDKLAGEPVDIYANERLIARGEILVLDENFCIRVVQLIADENQRAA